MKYQKYAGFIREGYGESDQALRLGDDNALADVIAEDMENSGHYLTVKYFISDVERSYDDMLEDWLTVIMGIGEAEFVQHYSDITGYLWTDENLMVGGHDLLQELRSYIGKYCLLEIEYRDISKD